MPPLLKLFIQSFVIGLSIAAPVGQIGVLAIQRTLQFGRAAGLATGLGAALADGVYGAIGAFGITVLMHALIAQRVWLAGIGAVLLLAMAWRIARQPPRERRDGEAARAPLVRLFAGTFMLTLSNPTTILSFLAVFGALAGATAPTAPWLMVAGVVIGSALWWLLLSTAVGAVRHRFDARWQRAVNLLSAAVLAGFACWQIGQLLEGPSS